MSTTTVKTIGSGGDYSTLQSWEDAAPANLTTSISGGEIWQGQCKNQTFSGTTNLLTVSGSTTDATGYKELTTESGASFSDNANVQTNALQYNTSNGAAISSSVSYNNVIVVSENYFRMSKLQVAATAGSSGGVAGGSSTNVVIDKCIIEIVAGTSDLRAVSLGASGDVVKNSLLLNRGTPNAGAGFALSNGAQAIGCTIVATKVSGNNALLGTYGTSVVKNCAIFNFAAIKTGGNTPTYTTCYTDKASPPSGFTTVAYDTSTGSGFQNITDATRDFRIKSTSAMIDVGTTDSTNGTPDIAGTARPSGSAYDVGCWEYVSAGPAFIPRQPYRINQAVQRANNW